MSEVPSVQSSEPIAVSTTLRVTYGEVDRMGVVYYANYLRWFEIGRAEWLRARQRTYAELEAQGVFLPVIEAHAEYLSPASYDDVVQVVAWVTERGPVKLRFEYRVQRDQTLIAQGYTVHVCIDAQRRLRRLPRSLCELF